MLIYEILLLEEAPPGREDQVIALKKKLCGGKKDCPAAYRIAWTSYNKSKIQPFVNPSMFVLPKKSTI